MTAEMAHDSADSRAGSRTSWLSVAVIGALVLATAAGFYRHGESDDARRAAARAMVVARQTRDLEAKVAAARTNLAASRSELRARTSGNAALSKALDQLNANHASMSSILHDQTASTAQIIDALARGQYSTYNALADGFTNSTRTVDALAITETKLRDEVTRACGDPCAVTEAAAVSAPRP
jgi:septal ring factor EnvC (AmiA/AmiB activator)